MQVAATTRHAGLVATIAGTLFLCVELYEGRIRRGGTDVSMRGVAGLPDCPPAARADFIGVDALQCWFYEAEGAWRIEARISAHRALVVHAEVTSDRIATPVADAIVRNAARRYGEVLLYASTRPAVGGQETSDRQVTRVRWTPRDGFTTLSFTTSGIPSDR